MSLLLTRAHFTPSSSVSVVNFEHAVAGWVTVTLAEKKRLEFRTLSHIYDGAFNNF